MKITRVKATAVNVPLIAPICWSWGGPQETPSHFQIEADDGITGLGETMERVGADNIHCKAQKNYRLKSIRCRKYPGVFPAPSLLFRLCGTWVDNKH